MITENLPASRDTLEKNYGPQKSRKTDRGALYGLVGILGFHSQGGAGGFAAALAMG
jgi:hypothetical protein